MALGGFAVAIFGVSGSANWAVLGFPSGLTYPAPLAWRSSPQDADLGHETTSADYDDDDDAVQRRRMCRVEDR